MYRILATNVYVRLEPQEMAVQKVSFSHNIYIIMGLFPSIFKCSIFKSRSISCTAVDCGTLGNPANGVVSVSTTTYNSVATYSCNTGHTLTGDDMRTCLDTGSWSDSEPTCIGEYS